MGQSQRVHHPGVMPFLRYLEDDRDNHIRTRNQRLAAVHTLFDYIATREPEFLGVCQQVAAIPMKRAGGFTEGFGDDAFDLGCGAVGPFGFQGSGKGQDLGRGHRGLNTFLGLEAVETLGAPGSDPPVQGFSGIAHRLTEGSDMFSLG